MVKPAEPQPSGGISNSSFSSKKKNNRMKETKSPEKAISVSSSAQEDDVAQPEELDSGYETDYKKLTEDLR